MTPVLSVGARNLDRHHQIEYQIYIHEGLIRKRATEVYGFFLLIRANLGMSLGGFKISKTCPFIYTYILYMYISYEVIASYTNPAHKKEISLSLRRSVDQTLSPHNRQLNPSKL